MYIYCFSLYIEILKILLVGGNIIPQLLVILSNQKVWGIEVPLNHMLAKCWFKEQNIIINKQVLYLQTSGECEVIDLHIFMVLSIFVSLSLCRWTCRVIQDQKIQQHLLMMLALCNDSMRKSCRDCKDPVVCVQKSQMDIFGSLKKEVLVLVLVCLLVNGVVSQINKGPEWIYLILTHEERKHLRRGCLFSLHLASTEHRVYAV